MFFQKREPEKSKARKIALTLSHRVIEKAGGRKPRIEDFGQRPPLHNHMQPIAGLHPAPADVFVKAMNKKMDNEEIKQVKCFSHEQSALFMDEFEKESDRAAGIVGAAILDSALESALKSYLVKSIHAKDDSLFDGPNAPLSSFSSKIDMMFRLGLISERMAKALHIVRRIRNNFAHDIVNCDFKNQQIVSLINELTILIFKNKNKYKDVRSGFPDGSRGDFQMALSRIVWWFWCGAFLKSIKERKSKKTEF